MEDTATPNQVGSPRGSEDSRPRKKVGRPRGSEDSRPRKKVGRPRGSEDSRPRKKRSADEQETDKRFGGIEKRLKVVEEENKRLGRIVVERDEIISFLKEENNYKKILIEQLVQKISNRGDGDDDLLKYLNH